MDFPLVLESIHYGTIAAVIGIPSLSVGIGEGLTCYSALKALNIQPKAHNEIINCAIIGTALIETVAILGLCAALLLLFVPTPQALVHGRFAELGIACALTLPGLVIGIASSWPAQATCLAIARQPFFAAKLRNFMLLMQTIIQTPMILCFVVAMLIKASCTTITTDQEMLARIAAGLCIGIGSLGPAIGLALYATAACTALGAYRKSYSVLFSFTLISQAIIETPMILAMTVAMMLMFKSSSSELHGIGSLAAALSMGLGTIGAGWASGTTSAAACTAIAQHPELYRAVSRTSMLAQGIIDTSAIYAFLIAMLILFTL